MTNNTKDFRIRLTSTTGLSESAISAAWPEWWDEDAEVSPSAQAELRFSIARKLGLDPTSLLDDDTPRFVWDDAAKYKNFTGNIDHERPAISSFGMSLGRLLVTAAPEYREFIDLSALKLRSSLLSSQPYIRLQDLLALLWGIGIPTIHLRVHPLTAKRMCAMTVRVGGRYAILLAKDAQYPAPLIFHLAHEIGHIVLGHVAENHGLVDMDDTVEQVDSKDPEEVEADRFALELLTGNPDFTVGKDGTGHSAKQLARESMEAGTQHQIEPGTLALCYGHTTKEWGTVNNAFKHIYDNPHPVWRAVNQVGAQQLIWESLSDENSSYLRAVMGAIG